MSVFAASSPGRRCAVLGSPIAHSLSPILHTAAYRYLRLHGWEYGRHEVDESALPAFLDRLDRSWRGLSLTMPLKHAALTCVDEVSDIARAVSAANTIILDASGRRRADNTDVAGMLAALRERGARPVDLAAVLGGGATARSAIAALRELTDSVVVYVRSPGRAHELAHTAAATGVVLETRPWADRRRALTAPVLLATTPAGVVDELASAVPEDPGLLFDVVYAPWPTTLAGAWSAAGGSLVGGLDLLVHQARLQVTLMTGLDVPVQVLRAAGEAALMARSSEVS